MDETWKLSDSPVMVTDFVEIPRKVTLIIEPGVEVRFAANAALIVEGKLIARGTQVDSILFTSADSKSPGAWGGIYLRGAWGAVIEEEELDFMEPEPEIETIEDGAGNIYTKVGDYWIGPDGTPYEEDAYGNLEEYFGKMPAKKIVEEVIVDRVAVSKITFLRPPSRPRPPLAPRIRSRLP